MIIFLVHSYSIKMGSAMICMYDRYLTTNSTYTLLACVYCGV